MRPTQILNRISTFAEYEKKMADFKNHVKMMIGVAGKPIPLHVMIVSGDKGVGKTYTATQILSQQNIRPFEIVTGALSAVQLYKFLWEHNDAIIVLDDVNSILQDTKDGASLLKACTDSYHMRELHWQKANPACINVHRWNLKNNEAIEQKMDEIAAANPKLKAAHDAGKTFPDCFFFTSALIILTNKPLSIIDRVTEGAVSNRGWHQEMLFNVDGAVDLIRNSASKMCKFNDYEITPETIKKTLEFMTSKDAISYYKSNGKLPTLRTLGKIALEYELGNQVDFDTLANNTEAPAY